MLSTYSVALFVALIIGANAFQPSYRMKQRLTSHLSLHLLHKNTPSTNLPVSRDKLILPESFLNPSMDTSSIAAIFFGQAILITSVILFEFFTNFNTLPSSSFYDFNLRAVTVATLFAIPLTLLAFVVKNIPWNFSMKVRRSREVFALRLLGYATPPIVALFTSFILSICAGYSEEVFFRGFVYSNILNASNVPIALLGSSLIFGLAHFPFVFGAQAIWESVLGITQTLNEMRRVYLIIISLGAYFGFVFWFSGYNLAIPIVAHAFYDCFTVFASWLYSSIELNNSLAVAQGRANVTLYDDPSKLKDTCRVV